MTTNVSYYIKDGKGDDGSVTINLDNSVSAADAIAFAQLFWPLLDALINGGNVIARVSFDVPGISSNNPVGSADVQELAKFVFRGLSSVAKKTMTIPTFLESKILPGDKVVDTTDADVAAFVTAMIDGLDTTGSGGSGIVQPTDYRSEDLTALLSAVEAWGKARK